MDQFFSHKTLKYPPALTKCGNMRHGEKSDFLKCLQPTPPKSNLPSVSAAALEELVLANMIKLKKNHTFHDYCSEMLILQLQNYTREYNAQRIDVVFDTYKQVNLKSSARTKLGKGIWHKVQVNSITLTNWRAFLRIDENKIELFRFLSQHSLSLTEASSTVLYTYYNVCQSNETIVNVQFLSPCNHEEADTCVFLHVKDMAKNGY